VDQCLHTRDIVDDVEDFRNINQGRTKQLFSQWYAEFGEDVVDRQFALLEKDIPRECQAIAVDAAALQPDDNVAGHEVAPGDDPVERHQSDRHSNQVKTAHQVLERGNLATRDRDPRLLGAGREADRYGAEHLRFGILDSDI